MAIPTSPVIADRSKATSVQPIQSTALVAQLTSNVTNTATSATLVTGLTAATNTVGALVKYVRVIVSGDSVYNSGANSVIISCWVGTVGSGTQVGQYTDAAQSSAPSPLVAVFYIPVSTAGAVVMGSSYTVNIGMHGSGAGTNTLVASTTAPCTMTVEFI